MHLPSYRSQKEPLGLFTVTRTAVFVAAAAVLGTAAVAAAAAYEGVRLQPIRKAAAEAAGAVAAAAKAAAAAAAAAVSRENQMCVILVWSRSWDRDRVPAWCPSGSLLLGSTEQLSQPLLRQPHELTAEQACEDHQQQQKQQQYIYEELQQCSSQSSARKALSSKVLLNVGGRVFATTYSTLRNFGPHYLSRCLSPPWRQGETREVFIDRNGDSFSYVLDFLRNGCLCCSNQPWLLQQLLLEARFFCIRPLEEEIEERLRKIRLEGVAVRCEEAGRLAAAAAVGSGRPQDCLANLMPLDSPLLQKQLLHMNHCRDSEANSLGRRSSRSSDGGSNSGNSESDCCSNVREPLSTAASAGANTPGETPQERAKLAQIAAAAELAARAESLRRSLVNDDPEPPEPQVVKDLGERVLLTDEDF
ncbi:potassium channel tetramerisation domain containing protein, putative [Eimeria mitis]|uniref:Potassium channel tetramerisation domain containing protein, putative n=1 Tax=Eimeria mitis TaxID=44415 RepID=U6JUD5_9EIME|nr:potassium channel tetramerisation domain containing protein, putative [Eimeria mitis]CDJ28351.1 potassium channel tetramerisation domain containing protein, putative [Eimeria mitis]